MSALTAEQRQRAEENRKKALQKRAEALARSSNAQPVRPPLNNPTTAIHSQQRLPTPATFGSINSAAARPPVQQNAPKHVVPIKRTFAGPMVTGVLKLTSRDRFTADIGYHAQLLQLFKQVPGCKYEPTTKKWTFPISAHGEVMRHIESLKPQVTAAPLPGYILRIFRDVESKPRIPDVDFTRIDPVLYQRLLPFQRQGVCFGISRRGRVLIADDMGLGKTYQALAIAHYYCSDWPLLIVTPSSMRYTWRDCIWELLPSVPAGGVCVVESNKDVIVNSKVIIMSYDILQRRHEETPIKKCKVVILDESHHVKNFKTARAQAAVPIVKGAIRAILLSGTPALSRPIELYTQVSAVNQNIFPNVNEFGIRYCAGKKNAWGWDYTGASNMEELQLILEETVMIRRLKSDVLKELPAKRRKMVILDHGLISLKHKGLQLKASAYNETMQKKDNHSKLLEYYAETAKVKAKAVQNYILDLITNEKKFIVFAHHRAMLDAISETLDGSDVRYIRIDGQTSSEQRKLMCDSFQSESKVMVAVLSITAANAGITLTAASVVVFAELFWNPGILTQAEDRAHRIGQEDSVIVEYLVAKGTADDALWALVVEKLDVLNKAGLTKDNFRESECTKAPGASSSSEPSSKSPTLHKYFKSQNTSTQQTGNRAVATGSEIPIPGPNDSILPSTQEINRQCTLEEIDPFEESMAVPPTQYIPSDNRHKENADPFAETLVLNDESDLGSSAFLESMENDDSLLELMMTDDFDALPDVSTPSPAKRRRNGFEV